MSLILYDRPLLKEKRSQTIRPMPRAYKQVVAILEKLDAVRANIQSLSLSLQQVGALSSALAMRRVTVNTDASRRSTNPQVADGTKRARGTRSSGKGRSATEKGMFNVSAKGLDLR